MTLLRLLRDAPHRLPDNLDKSNQRQLQQVLFLEVASGLTEGQLDRLGGVIELSHRAQGARKDLDAVQPTMIMIMGTVKTTIIGTQKETGGGAKCRVHQAGSPNIPSSAKCASH